MSHSGECDCVQCELERAKGDESEICPVCEQKGWADHLVDNAFVYMCPREHFWRPFERKGSDV